MDDSGPAFPATSYIVPQDLEARHVHALGKTQGMTLRDYFAAHCPHKFEFTMGDIAKYLGLPDPNERSLTQSQVQVGKERLDALRRYQWADAMIKVRSAAERAKEE